MVEVVWLCLLKNDGVQLLFTWWESVVVTAFALQEDTSHLYCIWCLIEDNFIEDTKMPFYENLVIEKTCNTRGNFKRVSESSVDNWLRLT